MKKLFDLWPYLLGALIVIGSAALQYQARVDRITPSAKNTGFHAEPISVRKLDQVKALKGIADFFVIPSCGGCNAVPPEKWPSKLLDYPHAIVSVDSLKELPQSLRGWAKSRGVIFLDGQIGSFWELKEGPVAFSVVGREISRSNRWP